MQVSIDKAGRIVLPKPLRDRFGLRPGTTLEVVEGSEEIILKPASTESAWKRDKNGHLVYAGQLPANIDWRRLVADDREERMRKIGGW